MLSLKKKGQGAGGAASLIALIAVFIVIYILFLPPQARQDLLENRSIDSSYNNNNQNRIELLLRENPGNIYANKQDEFDHRIDAFNLEVKESASVLKQRESVYVQSGGSNPATQRIILTVDDPSNIKNPYLSFTNLKHSGNLIITVNDEIIFNGELKAANPPPIPLDNLEEENIIEFSASSPGWMFWQVNYYQLSSVKIVGTQINYENQQADSQFFISYDAQKIVKSTLRYIPECRLANVGKLTIRVNNQIIASKVPDCGSPEQIEFDSSLLSKGANSVSFFSSAGNYLVDNILIHNELDSASFPTYFFYMNSTQFGKITNHSRSIVLSIKFADEEDKDAAIVINDIKLGIHQSAINYVKDIGPFVKEGNNYIRIEPEKTIPVQEIRVELKS